MTHEAKPADEPEEKKDKKPGRPKGTPKTGGREAGTPNRALNARTVLDALEAIHFPLVEMLVADIVLLEPRERVQELKWLFKYCYLPLRESDVAPPPRRDDEPPSGSTPTPEKPALATALSSEQRRDRIHGHVSRKSEAPSE